MGTDSAHEIHDAGCSVVASNACASHVTLACPHCVSSLPVACSQLAQHMADVLGLPIGLVICAVPLMCVAMVDLCVAAGVRRRQWQHLSRRRGTGAVGHAEPPVAADAVDADEGDADNEQVDELQALGGAGDAGVAAAPPSVVPPPARGSLAQEAQAQQDLV